MIIVAGYIVTKSGRREHFIELSRNEMEAARKTSGCHHFVVVGDPLEADRVHVFEAWGDAARLSQFRKDGPGSDLSNLIERVDVHSFAANPRPL